MKKFTFQAVFFLIIIAVSLMIYKTDAIVNLPFFHNNTAAKIVVINNALIKVEVADTQAKRKSGLGGREKLASDEGMLFVFDGSGKHPFWMKGMKFPLDIIWLDRGEVVDIATLFPPTKETPEPKIHASTQVADRVLELNAGMADELGIKPGLRLVLPW